MTDNRTTELKTLSKLKMAGKLRYWHGTIEIPECELHAICDEIQAEHDRALAATLGRGTCMMEYAKDGMMKGWWVCSECGKAMDTIESCAGRAKPRFCGNCGKAVTR